jgi:NADH-quinone oxidoreductase subunit N
MLADLNFFVILPEINLVLFACAILLLAVFKPAALRLAFYLALASLLISSGLLAEQLIHNNLINPIEAFHAAFVQDRLSVVLKIFMLVTVLVTMVYARLYNEFRKIAAHEFYVLGLLATAGMLSLVSAHNLLVLFLGVELLSLPTYAMVAMRHKDAICTEAAMKYFIIGALASGLLLYGFSMLYGATGLIDISAIANYFSSDFSAALNNKLAIFGLVFALSGVAFKLGAAPFHMWVPDVYEGAPSSVTLFIAAAPKLASFGMMMRLLVGALPSLSPAWSQMLIIVALLSMAIGNFSAIVQSSIKRMLAYSSIAHMGYMLLGMVCATPRGYAASLFYVITYSLMTLAAFGIVILMNRGGLEINQLEDFRGLNNRHPWLAFMMLVVMFSLAGVPPLVGFIAKIGLLEALIDVHLVWVAVLAILFAIIGAYYYLNIVKLMYFERAEGVYADDHIRLSTSNLVLISINAVLIVGLGIFPSGLFTLCHYVFAMPWLQGV